MRTDGIMQATRAPSWSKTDRLYMPSKTPISAMNLDEVRRGLCPRAMAEPGLCSVCRAQCRAGKRYLELTSEQNIRACSMWPPAERTERDQAMKQDRGAGVHVNLRRCLLHALMTEAQLAEAMDVSKTIVSAWVTGAKTPNLTRAVQICKILDCSLDDLVTICKEDTNHV